MSYFESKSNDVVYFMIINALRKSLPCRILHDSKISRGSLDHRHCIPIKSSHEVTMKSPFGVVESHDKQHHDHCTMKCLFFFLWLPIKNKHQIRMESPKFITSKKILFIVQFIYPIIPTKGPINSHESCLNHHSNHHVYGDILLKQH